MSAKNKVRGYIAEVALVNAGAQEGFVGTRTWASDGRSMGLDSRVDAVIGGETWQVKRIKTPPKYLGDMITLVKNGVVDAISYYFDHKGSWVFIPASRYFALRRAEARLRELEDDAR
jgi:hypothetical protein